MSAELFVEVQCEELPARFVDAAVEQLAAGLVGLLDGVTYGAVRLFSTPRRIAVQIVDVAVEKTKIDKVVTGPPADRAFDADGKPTKMALGFANGRGVGPEALHVVEGPKGPVVAVRVVEGGEQTAAIVAAGLSAVVLGLPFPKSMTWGAGSTRWARPIQRVSALYAGQVLSGTVGDVTISDETVGHRLAGDTAFRFASCEQWLTGLRLRKVEPDATRRRDAIIDLLADAANTLMADPVRDDTLLDEVVNLVEWPTLVLGAFDEELLALPPRLLVESMTSHQRYFPVYRNGQLSQHFVVISNNPWGDAARIAAGNEAVLRARFYDARFFFAEDQRKQLVEHGSRLSGMQWIRGLGAMAQRQRRIGALAALIAPMVGADVAVVQRAGALSKCDLTTQMVYEFPELQGHMGRLYALAQGESEPVANAIEEHWYPRFAGDACAASAPGACLALADRLDALVGCFGIGLKPKGGDPQGLRRAALGIVATLLAHGWSLDLRTLVRAAVQSFVASVSHGDESFAAWHKAHPPNAGSRLEVALADEIVAFIVARWRAHAQSEGASADLVDAVAEVCLPVPVVLDRRVNALRAVAQSDDFLPIMHTFKRVLNITRDQSYPPPAAEDLSEAVERALHTALASARITVHEGIAAGHDAAAFEAALKLAASVSAFFDGVMVDAPDSSVKAARVGLLLDVAALFRELADFSRISTR